MKVKVLLFTLCLLFFGLKIQAATENTGDGLALGDKQWQQGFKDENTRSKIIEYTLNGETVNNWSELFTYQIFKYSFPKEVTPIFFADTEIANIKAKGLKHESSIIKTGSDEVIIEFKVTSPVEQQQDELQRIIKTPEGHIIVLHYAVKKPDMGQEQRSLWTNVLQNVNLTMFN